MGPRRDPDRRDLAGGRPDRHHRGRGLVQATARKTRGPGRLAGPELGQSQVRLHGGRRERGPRPPPPERQRQLDHLQGNQGGRRAVPDPPVALEGRRPAQGRRRAPERHGRRGRSALRHLPPLPLGCVWDSTAAVGAVFPSQKVNTVTFVVVRGGGTDLGKWMTETRNVYEDYKRIYGEAPKEAVGAVSISINSQNTNSRAESYFGEILFRRP